MYYLVLLLLFGACFINCLKAVILGSPLGSTAVQDDRCDTIVTSSPETEMLLLTLTSGHSCPQLLYCTIITHTVLYSRTMLNCTRNEDLGPGNPTVQ